MQLKMPADRSVRGGRSGFRGFAVAVYLPTETLRDIEVVVVVVVEEEEKKERVTTFKDVCKDSILDLARFSVV